MFLDGKCPNEEWKYNTTLCQKYQADHPPRPDRPWDYCCEIEVPGLFEMTPETFTDIWNKLGDECFAKTDDHVAAGLVSGFFYYGVDSVLCELKTIRQ